MDTLPLPPRPDLAQYRKRAKELLRAARSNDDEAVRRWADDWLDTLARLGGEPITPFVRASYERAVARIRLRVSEAAGGRFTLADAQHLVAGAHGFTSWPDFGRQVERLSRHNADGDPFEAAADAVVTGDLPALEALVRRNPDLAGAHSARQHRATLLHYVAANGVEDFRQQTPPNAVAIATSLLDAGAEVDALANTYGGGNAQTTLNLLVSSTHPAAAGLQPALVDTLLDHGAAVDGLDDDGAPLMTALAFGYPGAAEALVRRGARIDNVMSAAALGRVDLVERLLREPGSVSPSIVGLDWLGLSSDPHTHVERAFVWACAFARTAVIDVLLGHGVDPGGAGDDGMTGLHWAAANGHVDVVRLLIERGAPLEARNRWGGTVLDSTVFFAREQPAKDARRAEVIELLVGAGADVRAVTYPTGNEWLDGLLKRHGARGADGRNGGAAEGGSAGGRGRET